MVDQLYHGLLAGSDDYGQLWSIVKMVLLLSHGCEWQIQSLKRRKLELSTDIDLLTASADQLSKKAESSRSRDMSILVKSNATHKACKEKTAEMTAVGRMMSWKTVNKF